MVEKADYGPLAVEQAQETRAEQRYARYAPFKIGAAGLAYIGLDDKLVVLYSTTTAGLRLSLRLRVQDPGGDVRIMRELVDCSADGAIHRVSFDLMEGYLLGGVCSLESGSAMFGELYVSLALGVGGPADLITTQALVTGYVSSSKGIGFPSAGDPSVYGPGHPHVVTVANPAAGAEWSSVVPAGVRRQILVAAFTLTCDATVAVRRTGLVSADPTPTTFSNIRSQDTQAAGTALVYEFSNMGIGHATQDGRNYEPLWQDVVFDPGWRIGSLTTNLQAGDQYSGITLYCREWVAS